MFDFIFQTALGMFKVREQVIVSCDNSAAIFNILSTLPAKLYDVDSLFKVMDLVAGTVVTDVIIEDNRRRQVAFLLSEQGSWRTGDIAAVARGNARVRYSAMRAGHSFQNRNTNCAHCNLLRQAVETDIEEIKISGGPSAVPHEAGPRAPG